MHLRAFGLMPSLLLASLALATESTALKSPPKDQRDWNHYNYVMAGPIFGQVILGSEDERRGQVYYLGRAFFSRKLSENNIPAFFVTEVYYNHTIGGDLYAFPRDDLHTFGITTIMRFQPGWLGGHGFFLDAGWGFSYGDIATDDLDSKINSTPLVGLGTQWQVGGYRAMTTMRFMHFSNAGTKLPNHGHNQLQILVGIQF